MNFELVANTKGRIYVFSSISKPKYPCVNNNIMFNRTHILCMKTKEYDYMTTATNSINKIH